MRSSPRPLHDVLRRALAAYLADDLQAPANYSLRGPDADDGGGAPRPLHLLYRSSTAIVRSRDAGPVVHGLLSHLSSLLDGPSDHILRLRVLALVSGDRAVLAPHRLILDLAKLHPWLERAGLRIVPAPHVSVDPASAELVIAPPRLEVDPSVLGDLGGDQTAEVVEAGRYRIAGWVFDTGTPPAPVPEELALAWALPTVFGLPGIGVNGAAQDLRRLLGNVNPVSAATSSPRARAQQLEELARA